MVLSEKWQMTKSISIHGLDSKVTEKRLKLLLYEFGPIEKFEYKISQPKKCNGTAKITFKNETSALQSLDFNGIELSKHRITISLDYSEDEQKIENQQKFVDKILPYSLVLFVFCISLITHFPLLSHPNEVVFDETHFGKFLSGYITGERFFDIHPPLAKLMLAGWAKYVCGYNGTFEFNTGQKYPKYVDYTMIRVLPCLCGSLVAPILTASMMLRHCSYTSSVLTGLLFAFDFTSIVQSRFILTDAIVYFFVSMTIFSSCLLVRYESWLVIFMQAFFGSAAFCSKFAAGGALVLVALSNMRLCLGRKNGFLVLCVRGIFCVIVLLTMLFGTIYLHLIFTPIRGYGDEYTVPRFRQYPMFTQIRMLLYDMYRYNRDLGFDHPYQSRWYEWPIFKAAPTLLWSEGGVSHVICIFNNPVTAYASLFGAIFALFYLNYEWFLTWFISYIPFYFVKRCTWTYHYEIPLIFGICGLSFVLDRFPKYLRNALYVLIICLMLIMFGHWYEWLYGLKVSFQRLKTQVVWEKLYDLWNLPKH